MYTRKQALALAKQLRTCPPPSIRNDPEFTTENENHIKVCPFCSIYSMETPHEIQQWQALSERFKADYPGAGNGQNRILAGQIRQVKPELGRWRDELYYNPPVVVVLKLIDKMNDAVQVAQVWQDTALAAPGDLVLPENMVMGFKELFIETWNIYTLRKSDLDRCFGTVSSKVVDQTLKMSNDPNLLPDWAVRPMPMVNEDPRFYFRQVEVETGYTFASIAAAALMDEAVTREFFSSSVTNLVETIKKFIPSIDWEWVPNTVEECLATLKFGPDSLALSAADKGYKEIIAVCLTLKNGRLDQIKAVECIIHHAGNDSNGYTISGEIPDLPDNLSWMAFKCHIKTPGEKKLFAGHWSWESREKLFIAEFSRPLKSHETISISVVYAETKED